MGSTRRDVGVSAAVAVGFLLLVWSASAGPASVFGGSGITLGLRLREVQEVGSPPPPGTGEPGSPAEPPPTSLQTPDLHRLGELVQWMQLLLFTIALVLAAVWLWRNRWRRKSKPAAVDFEVLPEGDDVVSAALSLEAHTQLTLIEEGDPRSAIVRCWLRLEEAVAAAGLPRAPSETSTEFTLRVLRRLDLDPRAVATLARLFREARFSDHTLGEPERSAARTALQDLHDDLAQLTSLGSGAAP